jgi:hypothetical protein
LDILVSCYLTSWLRRDHSTIKRWLGCWGGRLFHSKLESLVADKRGKKAKNEVVRKGAVFKTL